MDWPLAATIFFCCSVSFLAGRFTLWRQFKRALDEATAGRPLDWAGKLYTVSPLPEMPDFPGFTKQRRPK